MNYKIATLLLIINAGLFSCTKPHDSDLDPTKIDSVVQKPEWRIKKILTATTNIKLSLGFDTTYFSYDSLGRFSSIDYRMLIQAYNGTGTTIGYSAYGTRTINYEYQGNTEKIEKEYVKDFGGNLVVNEYVYNATQTQLNRYTSRNQATSLEQNYINLTNVNDKLTGYTYIQHLSPTAIDTTVVTITYTQNLITKKQDVRYNGGNINKFTYEYNAAGNPVYSCNTGEYPPSKPDTLRKIYFSWKSTITPNINKLKRPDRSFMEIINRGPTFYWQTYNYMPEFDIFNITSNGELLNSFDFSYDRFYGMVTKMSFQYELDSNQNISKVIGTVPGDTHNARMDMSIEYEKIK
jgi:hypothetical protein